MTTGRVELRYWVGHDGGLFQLPLSTWLQNFSPTPEPTPAVAKLLRGAQRRWGVSQRPRRDTL